MLVRFFVLKAIVVARTFIAGDDVARLSCLSLHCGAARSCSDLRYEVAV